MSAVSHLEEARAEGVRKKLHDEVVHILAYELNRDPRLYVELVNLLVVFRVLGPGLRVNREVIERLLDRVGEADARGDDGGTRVEYFLIVAILFCMGSESYYDEQRQRLQSYVSSRLATVAAPFERADWSCLIFDLLACSFVDDAYKRQVCDAVKIDGRLLGTDERRELFECASAHKWFTDWSARDDVRVLLERRRYRSPY